ncbi:unnamed protein product, partial [Meganyctiphanes norvegica]
MNTNVGKFNGEILAFWTVSRVYGRIQMYTSLFTGGVVKCGWSVLHCVVDATATAAAGCCCLCCDAALAAAGRVPGSHFVPTSNHNLRNSLKLKKVKDISTINDVTNMEKAILAEDLKQIEGKWPGSGQQNQINIPTVLEILEDEMGPMNMFVGNLSENIDELQLIATLSPYANVTSAFVIKKKFKDLKYGFVRVSTKDEVKKIMDLNKLGCYLPGKRLIFRPAHRYISPPGEEGFVRQPLPERDYDLSPFDPNKPSIHILVDDVLMKILEYLPLKERIHCEAVCRRWQALLYVMFGSTTHLNLRENYIIKNFCKISRTMLSKMLLLTGETIKSFSLYRTDDTLKITVFLMIAQLCPNLEYLDLSYVPDLYFLNAKALKHCKKLKYLSAEGCPDLKEIPFQGLISVLPSLEKLNVRQTQITGQGFNLLPKGLKELNISACFQVSNGSLRKVSKICENLEVLEMEHMDNMKAPKEFLKDFTVNCSSLRTLKLSVQSMQHDVSNYVKLFTKLTILHISAYRFELSNIADSVKNLEELHIEIKKEKTNAVDFGEFTQLKSLFVIGSPFQKQELMSIGKCRNLQNVNINYCGNADQETIKKIIKGCSEIKQVMCPKVVVDIGFIIDINEIMKKRSKQIQITVAKGSLASRELLETQYDTKKIDFEFVDQPKPFEGSDDDFSDDEDFYDSDGGHFGFNFMGYDSDDSLPDWMFYGEYADHWDQYL